MIKSKVKNEEIGLSLVQIAWGESGFDCSIKGDGQKYAQEKKESIMVDNKKYCSFGLWRLISPEVLESRI